MLLVLENAVLFIPKTHLTGFLSIYHREYIS